MEENYLYLYETIDDCKKELKKESLRYDAMSSVGENIINAIFRFIRCVALWISIFLLGRSIYSRLFDVGYKFSYRYFVLALIILIFIEVLASYAKYCYNLNYNKYKEALLINIIGKCKEIHDDTYSKWQIKAITIDMLKYAGFNYKDDDAE